MASRTDTVIADPLPEKVHTTCVCPACSEEGQRIKMLEEDPVQYAKERVKEASIQSMAAAAFALGYVILHVLVQIRNDNR